MIYMFDIWLKREIKFSAGMKTDFKSDDEDHCFRNLFK